MALAKIKEVTGRGVYVPGDDIDTDRIIPARFMKCVTFDGLGDHLFHDVKKDENGNDRAHDLNDPKFSQATILISGNNFGCGSSREHAPQAIYHAGYRAVIAEGFAEIFFGNSTQLGIVCAKVSGPDREKISAEVRSNPELELTIDVEAGEIRFGENKVPCEIREGARHALLAGRWDPLQDLIDGKSEVDEVAENLAYIET